MFERIKWWWWGFILEQFKKHYEVGGHCGLCGHWVPSAICPKYWTWAMCESCTKLTDEYEITRHEPGISIGLKKRWNPKRSVMREVGKS